MVTLPATRHGVHPLHRLQPEEQPELDARLGVFAAARNEPTKLEKLRRGVIWANGPRGRAKGQNFGIFASDAEDPAYSVAQTLWDNVYKPEAPAKKAIDDFVRGIHRLLDAWFAEEPDLRADEESMLEVVEKAFRGYHADGDDREYAALPNVPHSAAFTDQTTPAFEDFCEALLARCTQLRERYPNCLTWPAPGPPPPSGGNGDPLDGLGDGMSNMTLITQDQSSRSMIWTWGHGAYA